MTRLRAALLAPLAVLTAIALLTFAVTVLGAGATAAGKPTGTFCDRHPANPKCSTPTPTPTPTPTATATPTPTPTATATPTPPAGGTCAEANATYVWNDWGQAPLDEYSTTNRSQYFADAGLWNWSSRFAQHTVFCDHASWYAVVTDDNASGDGSVKNYPNTHMDYYSWDGSGFMPPVTDPDNDPSTSGDLYSTFAHQTEANAGAYNWSYDIWLNGVGWNGTNTEVMIWTDYANRVPWSRNIANNITVDGRQWNLWREDGGGPGFQYLPANGQPISSGTVNLSAFFRDLTARGFIGTNAKLGQVCYGVETVSTGGQPKRFDVTDFSVSIPPHDYYH